METTPPNPFEPPRTTDLDAAPGTPPAARFVPDEALDELAYTTPWSRRLSRLTVLSIALQLASLANPIRRFAVTGTMVLMTTGGIAISVLFLIVLRRYAAASERFRDGDDDAIGGIVAAQLSFLKLTGILATIGVALFIYWVAGGFVSGRWLTWVHR